MRKYFVFLIAFIVIHFGFAQNLGSFIDYQGRLNIFDNGNIISLEGLAKKGAKVGGNCVLYTDQSDNFKAYYQGRTYDLADFTPAMYSASDDLGVFATNRIVSVFDNGNVVNLPGWANSYVAGDSIVGYFDVSSDYGYYRVYYGGTTEVVSDVFNSASVSSVKAGDNILAYINGDGLFKAYYHGQIYDLGTNHVSSYQLGSSTVAYMDEYNVAFKVFYNGVITTLETMAPKSYKGGDQLVAYVDNSGNFKIFYKGEVTTISTVEPDFYAVDDNVVAFGTENVSFNVFYMGKVYPLESNTPASYEVDFNSVAYIDKYGYLKIFTDGQTNQAYYIKVPKFKLTKNVLMFKTSEYDYHFYLNGKLY